MYWENLSRYQILELANHFSALASVRWSKLERVGIASKKNLFLA